MKQQFAFFILFSLLFSCQKQANDVTFKPPTISILSSYSIGDTDGEANVMISSENTQVSELGVVWSEKTNPTTADSRQSITEVQEENTFFFKLTALRKGQTYYVRAYYVLNGETAYSPDEFSFVHNYTNNWVRMFSPKLESGRYISSDGVSYSGSGGGLTMYSVDRNTNMAKPAVFYPSSGDWGLRYYIGTPPKDAQMRYGPFRANFTAAGNIDATLLGGGYYKDANGQRFFLKNFKIDGIDGYTWDPPYPGADALTSGFGVSGYGFVLENKANGKLWRFDPNKIKWDNVATVPMSKEAKFMSIDIGERAFVLVESENWNDELDGFYEFIAATNQWQKKKNFAGENRRRAVGFAVGGKVYYGAGQSAKTLKPLRDIWEYNPATDAWLKVADYPGSGTINLVALGLGSSVYIGFGQQALANANKGEILNDVNDFWRYKP